MRKRLIVTTATALLLLVSACGSSGSDSGGGDASASASKSGGGESANLDQVEWVEGEPPGLDFEAPFALDESFALEVVKEGSGEPAAAGSGISVNYVYYQGSDGSEIESTYQAGVPLSHELDSGVSGSDVLYRATVGQSAGAQIIVAWQANATGGSDGESESSDGPVTYLMALTLETVTPGETITPTDPALPTVVLAPSGRPSIVVPAGTDPPTELKREVFKEGDGAVVAATDSVSVNYTGWLWDG
ncbi:MAG: hypothetical protein LBG11_05180, partial [Bifidobacteriaceae bacterium]|nr:hypothetical protein [Bifidobacteriaceae bacterium]